jgi:aspartate racemase
MPAHIGIVACSAEGAALCYRSIVLQAAPVLGTYAHPEITMSSLSFAEYMRAIESSGWPRVGDLMLDSAHKLARAGADFLICPDNTIHQALPLIEARSPRPWLHIALVVAEEARLRGFRRIGLLGTRWLVDSSVYPDQFAALGIECLRPTPSERDEINRLIMEELVRGIFTSQAIAFHQSAIARMKDQGCDAVVLGCTEIPLIMNDNNSPLPTLDSTRLLARAALARAVQQGSA